jgi:hypothetical protein
MTLPEPADLLDIARKTLLEQVLPGLAGDARFKALMIANAMAIGERALRAVQAVARDDSALCAAIRRGDHDGDRTLAATLLAEAEARCRISAPKALTVPSGRPGR